MVDRFALYADETNPERARSVLDSAEELSRGLRTGESRLVRGLSVVILNQDHHELIVPLVEQLQGQRDAFRNAGLAFEVAIGDTGSASAEVHAAYARWEGLVTVVPDLPYHFSKCNNRVARQATSGDSILFMNNDVALPERDDVLLSFYRSLRQSPGVGILGAPLYFPDDTLQHLGIDFLREPPLRGFPFHPHAHKEISDVDLPAVYEAPATTGAFLLIRRSLFDRIGGFVENYEKECQDVDLCLQAHRLGYRTEVKNLGRTVHLENATRPKGEESWPDRRLFLRRWCSYVEAHFL